MEHGSGRIIGIDLGTTNSVVAVMEGKESVVIANQEGANKTPSVVAFLDNNECIVGEIARRQAATNPLRTISSVKRVIGLPYEEVEEMLDIFPFQLVEHNDQTLIDVDGLGYTAEQISALVLKKLKESAESFLGEAVSQAVITVPAHFDDRQRHATIEAATLAGLNVMRLLNEPTAAALAYGLGRETDTEEIIAVFDFGGGTFDITILEVFGKTFEVLTSTGDTHLGGDDLDNAIVNMLMEEFADQHQVDLREDPVTMRRLKEVAEKAKCELSTATQTSITLPFIAYREGTPLHLERLIKRGEFEEMIETHVNRTIQCCRRALEDAGMKKNQVDKVILVGGSTRIPLVQDAVEDFFGLQPFKGINPDEVVALGAATQAGIFSGNLEEVTLLDVAPHSLGIEVKDGRFSPIIDKNATIPIKAAKNFTTTEDNQTFVNIHILQGESEGAADNRSLGKFTLTDIPVQDRGKPRIRVTFFVNADGVMEISAEELSSNVSKSLTIVHSDLDEREKKQRKRARRRKTGGGGGGPSGGGAQRESRSAARRYSSSSTGAPQKIDRPSGEHRLPNDRNADSSIAPVSGQTARQESQFEVIGDASPGTAPTLTIPSHPGSKEAVPLEPSGEYRSPQRYGRGSHTMNTPVPLSERPSGGGLEVADEAPDNASYPLNTPLPVGDMSESHTAAIPLESIATHVARGGKHLSPEGYGAPADLSSLKTEIFRPEEMKTPVVDDNLTLEVEVEEPAAFPQKVLAALELARAGAETGEANRRYAEAIEELAKGSWKEDARYDVLSAKALLRIMMGQAEEAREMLVLLREKVSAATQGEVVALQDKAIDRFVTLYILRRDRAKLRERIGDLDGACEDMEFSSKTDPSESDAADLERLYRKRMEKKDDPAAKFKLVKLLLKNDRVDEAVDILEDLQHYEPYETRAVKILGLCHWQKNMHVLAWQRFRQLALNDEIRDILYRLGTDMEQAGHLQNSLAVFEHLARDNENYRDVAAKIKKLKYRIKIQEDENESSKVSQVLKDSRFEVIEEINRGSMGIIYKARDKILDEVVALKILNDYLCSDPSAIERFKREARAAKKLSHPYIVRIHDMFETGSKRFISMEYIEGTDLKRMLANKTSFMEEQLIYYFLQICDALAYAHRLNIIHRDIKPANIMITLENQVKITDFGIAKMLKSDDSTKSGTAVIGTPLYMAPEQITGEGVDARTDIYSLGIMMYELVAGHPPFYLGNIEYHHIHSAPPPLPERVSAKLREVIMKCVEKDPASRFSGVDQIFEKLNVQR